MTEDGYTGSRLVIQLKFSDPLSVSQKVIFTQLSTLFKLQDYDYLMVRVTNNSMFEAYDYGNTIQFKYRMMKKIPR